MGVTRRAVLKMSVATALTAAVVLGGPGLSAVAEPAPRGIAPEADTAHHGRVSLWGDRLGVLLRTGNRGPSPLADVTVRLRFSVPLAAAQQLPPGCLRGDSRTVLCSTGPLPAAGEARRTTVGLRLTGRPAEVVVRVDTLWNGGASDRNRRNDTHEVLAPATGDRYAF
ncbi:MULTISPECIES: hypothetical protein [unclassified Streptomyces]|uniref:hypothetical protein n=1 Tax=unclassified Streptomyces TaxID=2593676 RepID=UPI000D1AA5C2|nr:hypothetical protein [Streptomyces sp. CB02058]